MLIAVSPGCRAAPLWNPRGSLLLNGAGVHKARSSSTDPAIGAGRNSGSSPMGIGELTEQHAGVLRILKRRMHATTDAITAELGLRRSVVARLLGELERAGRIASRLARCPECGTPRREWILAA